MNRAGADAASLPGGHVEGFADTFHALFRAVCADVATGSRASMGALLVAIEDDAEPENGAAENLHSLALCFAAIASRRTGAEEAVGSVRKIDL